MMLFCVKKISMNGFHNRRLSFTKRSFLGVIAKFQITLFKFDFVELKVRKCFSTTDCTDYTDFSSQGATMAGCRTIRMAGAAEAQKSV